MPNIESGADHNGLRLARARRRMRWNQERLALETGFSTSAIRAFEQGRRSLDSMRQLTHFARVLGIPLTELTGQPYLPAAPEQDAGHSAVGAIRRELLLAVRPPRISDADAMKVSVPALRARTDQLHAHHRATALSRMGQELPGLLRDLRTALHVVPDAQRAAVYRLQARAYEAAMDMLKQSGYLPDSTTAIERARAAAQQADDPMCALTVDWHYAGEFLRVGELDEADDIIENGLRTLRPLAGQSTQATALAGAYELKSALIRARAGDTARMWERWQRAEDTASTLGHDLSDPLAFGPSNTAIWSVALPVEALDAASAVTRAETVNPFLEKLTPAATIAKGRYSAERLSHHWIDVARAYYYRADRDQALTALLRAERIAPQKTRISPAAREIVGHMLRTRRKNDLVELGLRMGI